MPTWNQTQVGADNWNSQTIALKGVTTNSEVYIAASSNITDGEATTAQLTAPSGKSSGTDFDAGKLNDATNDITADPTADDYTEVEWCLKIATGQTGTFNFRVSNSGTALDTYTVTPDMTVSSAVTVQAPVRTHTYTAQAPQVHRPGTAGLRRHRGLCRGAAQGDTDHPQTS